MAHYLVTRHKRPINKNGATPNRRALFLDELTRCSAAARTLLHHLTSRAIGVVAATKGQPSNNGLGPGEQNPSNLAVHEGRNSTQSQPIMFIVPVRAVREPRIPCIFQPYIPQKEHTNVGPLRIKPQHEPQVDGEQS